MPPVILRTLYTLLASPVKDNLKFFSKFYRLTILFASICGERDRPYALPRKRKSRPFHKIQSHGTGRPVRPGARPSPGLPPSLPQPPAPPRLFPATVSAPRSAQGRWSPYPSSGNRRLPVPQEKVPGGFVLLVQLHFRRIALFVAENLNTDSERLGQIFPAVQPLFPIAHVSNHSREKSPERPRRFSADSLYRVLDSKTRPLFSFFKVCYNDYPEIFSLFSVKAETPRRFPVSIRLGAAAGRRVKNYAAESVRKSSRAGL